MISMEAIGVWRTPLKTRQEAPKQGIEAGITAEIELDPRWVPGLTGMKPGAFIWVLSYFNQAKEPELMIHPRNDKRNPKTGLFNTRSPNRPAPVAMGLVEVLEVEGNRLSVKGVDALDGTPVLDLKPYIARLDSPQPA